MSRLVPSAVTRLRRRPFVRLLAGLTAGRLVAAAISAAWLVVAARLLTLTEFGDLALVLALGNMVAVAADLGVPLILTRAAAERASIGRSLVRRGLTRRMLGALPVTALLVALYNSAAHERSLLIPLTFGTSIAATAVYSSFTAVLRGQRRVALESWNEVISRLGVLLAGTLWLSQGGGVLAAVLIYSIADIASAVVVPRLASRLVVWSPDDDGGAHLSWTMTAPLAAADMLGVVYARLDTWLLALIAGAPKVALYAAAARLFEAAQLPARALSAMAVPFALRVPDCEPVAGAPAARGQHFRSATRRLSLGAVAITVPVALLVAVFATDILRLAFGPRYLEARAAVLMLMVATVPASIVLATAPLVATTRPIRFAASVLGALATNVTANLVLIPMMGSAGAALAAFVSAIVLATALLLALLTRPQDDKGRRYAALRDQV